ncbi:MAG: hypothetical protein NC301_06075 [Bacteroides sp.]|nr:hypothetical protein [Bacteroides sp.]MCM1379029.1 hypothetical protein [Bacteroides sp.]MCM1445645.1 hypothetical protein [Prevotella sp.]
MSCQFRKKFVILHLMINPKYIILLFIGCMALIWACRPSVSPERVASEVTDEYLDTVSIPQLCMQSITLAKLNETANPGEDYTALALNCYRTALHRDSVAASAFYNSLGGDDFKYYQLLRQLDGRVDARTEGIYPEEGDSING